MPKSLKAETSAFVSQSGDIVSATVKAPEFSGRNGTVRITSALPFGGPYTAQLTLEHDGVVDPPLTVSVTRTRIAAPATVDGVSTVSAQSAVFGRRSVVRRLTLTEAAGRDLVLEPPIVVAPSQAATGQVLLADIYVAGIARENGSTDATCMVADGAVTLKAGKSCPLVLTLDMPAAPATYDATVRFGAVGYTPVEDKLRIQTRVFWWLALLLLAVGVLLGAVLLRVLQPARDRLNARIQIRQARDELEADARRNGTLDESERRVLDGLYALLDRLDAMTADDPAAATTGLTVAQTQIGVLGAWIDVHRTLLKTDRAVRDELKPTLDGIAEDMQKPTLDATAASGLRARLQDLKNKVGEKTLKRLQAQAERLRGQAPQLGLAVAGNDLADALDRVMNATATQEAASELARAQRLVGDALATSIAGVVGKDAMALGLPIGPARWELLRARVGERLQEASAAGDEERILRLRQADSDLVGGIAAAAAEALRTKRENWATSASPNLQELAKSNDRVLTKLEKTMTAAAAGRLGDAHGSYDAAQAAWREAEAAARKQGAHLGSKPDERLPDLPAISVEPIPPVPAAGELPPARRRTPLSALRAQRTKIQAALLAVAVVVAVLVGFATLYLGDPTWGGPEDVVAALLWGLGLTAAGTAAGFAGAYTAVTR